VTDEERDTHKDDKFGPSSAEDIGPAEATEGSAIEGAPPADTEGGGPEGASVPDRFGMGEPQGDTGTTAAAATADLGAPPRVDRAPPGRPPREDLPPNATDPRRAAGWDEAADLTKDPAVIPDPAEVDVPDELRRAIESAMALYPDRRSASIPSLHAAQAVHGWCSPTAIRQVAAVMQVTPAYLSSVASFYDMLNERPVGRGHVYVCTSVACHMSNAKRVYDAIAEAGRDLEDVEIREFECLGACDMAPMASVDGRYVGPLDVSDAEEIVDALRENRTVLPGRGLEDSDYRLPWEGKA
jgi:NADH:ubiquinone oxidoreductase subunit E